MTYYLKIRTTFIFLAFNDAYCLWCASNQFVLSIHSESTLTHEDSQTLKL